MYFDVSKLTSLLKPAVHFGYSDGDVVRYGGTVGV